MASQLRVGLLGPVEAQRGQQIIDPGRLQNRQLLALLALNAGAVVRADTLIEQIWADNRPQNPRKVLSTTASRLRAHLVDKELLTSERTGYRLHVESVDVDRFEALIAGSLPDEPATRLTQVEEALALWRGEPFGDILGPTDFGPVAEKMYMLRSQARRLHAQALLETNDPYSSIDIAQSLLAEDPESESLAIIYASGLAQIGERGRAIDALSTLRDRLRNQRGIEPSQRVDDLERKLLTASIELTSTAPDPTPTDAPSQLFVGRENELQQLDAAIAANESVVIVGEPGRGKSYLLRELRDRIERQGTPVVSVTALQDPTTPLEPIAQLTSQLFDRLGEKADIGDMGGALARILPSRFPADESTTSISRTEFLEVLPHFIASTAGRHGVCLILDDLHFIDASSAAILKDIVTAGACTVVLGSRPTDDGAVLDEFANGGLTKRHLDLPALSLDDVSTFIARRGGGESYQRWAGDIHQLSGGNPLFLALLVDHALAGTPTTDQLPTNVLLAVQGRLDALASRAKMTLQYAAAIGPEFDLRLLRHLRSGADADIAAAAEHRLIRLQPEHDRGEFIHHLVADAAYQLMPAGIRAGVHHRIVDTINDRRDEFSPAELATHSLKAVAFDEVTDHRDLRDVIWACYDAGCYFLEGYALELAVQYFTDGLDLAQTTPGQMREPELMTGLLVSQGRAQRLLGHPDHVTTLQKALELASGHGDVDMLGRGVIELCSLGRTSKAGSGDEDTIKLVESTLREPSLSLEVKAELLAAASAVMAVSRHWAKGQAYFAEGWALAKTGSDPMLEARVLIHSHLGLSHPDTPPMRAQAIDRLDTLIAADDVEGQWEIAYLRYWQALIAADHLGIAKTMDSLRRIAPQARHRHVSIAHLETSHAILRGDFDQAAQLVEPAFELAKSVFPESWATAHYQNMLFAISLGRNRLAELQDHVDAAIDAQPETLNWHTAAALIAADSGDIERATVEFDRFKSHDFTNLTEDLSWTGAAWLLGKVALRLDDGDSANLLYRMLASHAGRMSSIGTTTVGPIDEVLGELAQLCGRSDDATRHFQTADQISQNMRCIAPGPAATR